MPIRKGQCGKRDEHKAHFHDSKTLGHFWCRGVEERELNDRGEMSPATGVMIFFFCLLIIFICLLIGIKP